MTTEGTLGRIKLGTIKVNQVALRPAQTEDPAFQELLHSVRAKGVLKPILVNDNGDGSYTLIDGLQRYTCATMVAQEDSGPKEIDAKIIKVNSEDELALQIILNNNTVKTKPIQYAEGIMRVLAHNPLMNQAELAEKLGMSQPTLSNLLKLTRLSKPIQELVNNGSIKVTNAYILAKVADEFQGEFLEAAQTDSPEQFTNKVNEFNKAQKASRANLPAPTMPSISVRKKPILEAKYLELTQSIAGESDPDPIVKAQVDIMAWVLSQDADSVKAWKEAKEKAEAEKAKKQLEASTKKVEEANKKAEEARQKMAALNS